MAWKRADSPHPLFHTFELTSHGRGLHASGITSSGWFFSFGRLTILPSGAPIDLWISLCNNFGLILISYIGNDRSEKFG